VQGGFGLENTAEHNVFLRSNTAEGCVSFLPDIDFYPQQADARVVLLKSGYGGGASALLEEVLAHAQGKGQLCEVFWDAPGRERLCALRLPEARLCILDAEAPYSLEARLPGVSEELFSLDCCRDNAILRARRGELMRWREDWQRGLLRAGQYLRAARAIKRDMRFIAGETMDFAKLERYASRFAALHFAQPNGQVGSETRCFLTAVTGQGLLLRRSALAACCDQAVVLEDDYGVAAPHLWNLLRAYALGNGLSVLRCHCSLDPFGAPEHLLLPELSLACVTANRRHPIELEGAKRVLASRFFDKEAMRTHRCRLGFCRRSLRELLAEAYQAQSAAEEAKAKLDTAYAAALLPEAVAKAAARLVG
jgi:hypothetical protein